MVDLIIAVTVLLAIFLIITLFIFHKDDYSYINLLQGLKKFCSSESEYLRKRNNIINLLKKFFVVVDTGLVLELIVLIYFAFKSAALDLDEDAISRLMWSLTIGFPILTGLVTYIRYFIIVHKK